MAAQPAPHCSRPRPMLLACVAIVAGNVGKSLPLSGHSLVRMETIIGPAQGDREDKVLYKVYSVCSMNVIFYKIDDGKEKREGGRDGGTGTERKTRAFLHDHITDFGRLPLD